jgi:hypothetical protein
MYMMEMRSDWTAYSVIGQTKSRRTNYGAVMHLYIGAVDDVNMSTKYNSSSTGVQWTFFYLPKTVRNVLETKMATLIWT